MLTGRAEQAATVDPKVLEPGVRGEAGRSHEEPLRGLPGIKATRRGKGASASSSSRHQRADGNRDPVTKENTDRCAAANKSKGGIQREAVLMSRRKPEAPSREDTTERRPPTLKGTVPRNQHLATPLPVRRRHHQRKQPRTLTRTFATLSHLKGPIRLPLGPIQGATSSWETYKVTYARGLLRPSAAHIITAPGYLSGSPATAVPGENLNLHCRNYLRGPGAACSSRSLLQGWPISIWVMRCGKAFQERNHNHLEIRSGWLSAINSRLTEDKK